MQEITTTYRKSAFHLKVMFCVSAKEDVGIFKKKSEARLAAYFPQSGNSDCLSKIPYQFLIFGLMCLLESFERYMRL